LSCHDAPKQAKSAFDDSYHRIVLLGNPNVGKSVIFNSLTDATSKVGNFPGVTVSRKHGYFLSNRNIEIIDLPGSYSLSFTSPAEIVTCQWILENPPDLIINVVDSSNLQRNLYLTTILLEIGIPIILVLNMVDVAQSKGININPTLLSKLISLPVFPLIATNKNSVLSFREWITKQLTNFSKSHKYPLYDKILSESVETLQKTLQSYQIDNSHWIATKLLEGDQQILKLDFQKLSDATIQSINSQTKKLRKNIETYLDDPEVAFPNDRYRIIKDIVSKVTTRNVNSNRLLTNQIDEVLTHKWLGIPIFLSFMWLTFKFTFEVATPLMEYIDIFFNSLGSIVEEIVNQDIIRSIIVDGVLAGVGGILIFLPNIFFLYISISILEDSGYLTRAAFIMDRLMVSLGMEGRSFVPMLIGFGCNVPAIMATRNIAGTRERLQTIFISPFMSCSARLPVYVLFASIFFVGHESEIVMSLYLLGIISAMTVAFIFKYIHPSIRGFSTPLVLEMPPYLQPTFRSVSENAIRRSKSFIRKAGTIILLGSLVIWFFSHFVLDPISIQADTSQNIDKTLLGVIGKIAEPLFGPLHLNWQLIVGLAFGLIAKELVVAALGIIYVGSSENEGVLRSAIAADPSITPLIAFAYMAFVLLYVPCLPTLGAIKSELGRWRWSVFTFLYTTFTAFIVALGIILFGTVFLGLEV
jgi:ferrous iron transport protein B